VPLKPAMNRRAAQSYVFRDVATLFIGPSACRAVQTPLDWRLNPDGGGSVGAAQ